MGTKDQDSKKFGDNSLDLFNNPYHLLPECYVSENSGKIQLKDFKMLTTMDEKGVTHHYSVTWTEDKNGNIGEEKVETITPTPEPESSSTVSTPVSTPPKLKKTASKMKIAEGLKKGEIQCEGPCNAMRSMAQVVQFGCDHVICDFCRRSQKSAALFDGSPGCCHKDCLIKAEAEGIKLLAGRRPDSIASSLSLRSNEGPWEVLYIHVCLLKRVAGHVYKTQLAYEFPSQTRVIELAKTLSNYNDLLSTARIYYSISKPKIRQDLKPISINDTNLRFYHLPGYVPLSNGKLFVLIVGKGVQVH